jgi:lipid-A-disaccharide synthase
MRERKHVVIIAGEESGDIHASVLIKQLKAAYPDIQISGIGGKHMEEAGAELISDLARYGVTGLTEVIRYLAILRNAFKKIKTHLEKHPPDLLILVDYPGFNLRLARYAKKVLGLKILYYISPQIWAWKAKRIHLIKECIDQMAVILPFEKKIYEDAGVPVCFVGHPLVEKIALASNLSSCRKELELPPEEKIIAMLPGSRTNEIERHMPVLRETAILLHQQYPDLRFLIPIAGTIHPDKIKAYFANYNLPIIFIQGKAIECMTAADFVIVASGTASLECALLEKPMCIIYKSSLLTYIAATQLVKVKFLGLCNLLTNKMTVPEFLQYDCNAIELAQYISNFTKDTKQPQQMIGQLFALKESLSSNKSDCTLFDLVAQELS